MAWVTVGTPRRGEVRAPPRVYAAGSGQNGAVDSPKRSGSSSQAVPPSIVPSIMNLTPVDLPAAAAEAAARSTSVVERRPRRRRACTTARTAAAAAGRRPPRPRRPASAVSPSKSIALPAGEPGGGHRRQQGEQPVPACAPAAAPARTLHQVDRPAAPAGGRSARPSSSQTTSARRSNARGPVDPGESQRRPGWPAPSARRTAAPAPGRPPRPRVSGRGRPAGRTRSGPAPSPAPSRPDRARRRPRERRIGRRRGSRAPDRSTPWVRSQRRSPGGCGRRPGPA